jgi:hypothetical protein
LSVIAVVAAGVALKTLRQIKVQARIAHIGLRAARVAASAATASARVAADAAEMEKRALHLTERADILIEGLTISTYPRFAPESTVGIKFRNFGRTRGNQIQVKARLYTPDLGEDEEMPAIEATTVLGPGNTLTCRFQPMWNSMTGETFHGIINGQMPLRFASEIAYIDVFDPPHRTKCSGTFLPETTSFRIDANQEAD